MVTENLESKSDKIRKELGIRKNSKPKKIEWPEYPNADSWNGQDIERIEQEMDYLNPILAYVLFHPRERVIDILYDRLNEISKIRKNAYKSTVWCPF